ncbi:MAG: AlpA family phage regulatory protein [Halopseudomonas sp.]
METQLKIQRKPETLSRYGLARSTFHTRINEGLIPPPISLGERAVGFAAHETDQVLAFMMAGKSKEQIRTLVAHLIEQRQLLVGGSV